MSIRDVALDRALKSGNMEAVRYRRKANQEWEMAGLARQDNDPEAAAIHTNAAKQYERLAREAET